MNNVFNSQLLLRFITLLYTQKLYYTSIMVTVIYIYYIGTHFVGISRIDIERWSHLSCIDTSSLSFNRLQTI